MGIPLCLVLWGGRFLGTRHLFAARRSYPPSSGYFYLCVCVCVWGGDSIFSKLSRRPKLLFTNFTLFKWNSEDQPYKVSQIYRRYLMISVCQHYKRKNMCQISKYLYSYSSIKHGAASLTIHCVGVSLQRHSFTLSVYSHVALQNEVAASRILLFSLMLDLICVRAL